MAQPRLILIIKDDCELVYASYKDSYSPSIFSSVQRVQRDYDEDIGTITAYEVRNTPPHIAEWFLTFCGNSIIDRDLDGKKAYDFLQTSGLRKSVVKSYEF